MFNNKIIILILIILLSMVTLIGCADDDSGTD